MSTARGKRDLALPAGIDRLPSGALRVRVYEQGRRRTVGTYCTLAAAIAAQRGALDAQFDATAGRTTGSDAAWARRAAARVRLIHPDDRALLDVILLEMERRAADRYLG